MSQQPQGERRHELARMTKKQLIALCREGIRRPDGKPEVIEGDLENWLKSELVEEILSVEQPESPALAGLTPVGEADPRAIWQAVQERAADPGFQETIGTIAGTSQGLLALERARGSWTRRGLEVPWPSIVSVPLAAAHPAGQPGDLPPGTRASRCTVCGETRLSYPGDLTDEWKHHFDTCTATGGESR